MTTAATEQPKQPERPPRPIEPRPPTTDRLSAWWVMAAVLALGLLLVAAWQVRAGGFALAAAPLVAAILRLVLPQEKAGGLVIRTVRIDVALYLFFAAALTVATMLLRLT